MEDAQVTWAAGATGRDDLFVTSTEQLARGII
jgi:hypothetical protein